MTTDAAARSDFQPRHPWLDRAQRWVSYIGARGWLPIVAVLLAVAGLWGYLELADEVTDQETDTFDRQILEVIGGGYEEVGGFWQEAGRDVTAMGGSTVITLMVTAVVVFLLLNQQWKSSLFVVASVVGGLVISLVLKDLYDRPRPILFDHRSHTMTASFPSGHSANSAVAYFTMAVLMAKLVRSPWLKAYIFFVGLLIPALVGFSRIFLGVHWPTDVIAGWLIGLSWGLIVWGVATFLQRRGGLEREGDMADHAKSPRNPTMVS